MLLKKEILSQTEVFNRLYANLEFYSKDCGCLFNSLNKIIPCNKLLILSFYSWPLISGLQSIQFTFKEFSTKKFALWWLLSYHDGCWVWVAFLSHLHGLLHCAHQCQMHLYQFHLQYFCWLSYQEMELLLMILTHCWYKQSVLLGDLLCQSTSEAVKFHLLQDIGWFRAW